MNKTVVGIFLTKAFTSAVNLALLLITVRWMGAEQRGLISKFILELSFVMLFAEWIVGPVLVYYISKHSLSSIIQMAIKWITLMVVLGTAMIAYMEPQAPLFTYAGLFFLQCIFSFHNQVLLANQKYFQLNASQILQSFICLALLLVHLTLKEYTLVAYLHSLLVSSVLGIGIQAFFISKLDKRKELSALPFAQVWKSGSYTTITNLFHLITTRNSYMVISMLSTTAVLGIYSTAVSMSEAMLLAASSMGTFLYSKFSNHHSELESRSEAKRFMLFAGLITVLFIMVLLVIPTSFFASILGKDFTGVKEMIVWLSPGIIGMALIQVLSHYFSAKGQFKLNFWAGLAASIFIVLGARYGMKQWGLFGVTQATNLAIAVQLMMLLYFFISSRMRSE
jgi:O-antigen/teichoic acid export membrane protein